MKDTRPEWYKSAKDGLETAVFTEEMKLAVNRRIEQAEPRKKYGLWLAVGAAVAVCAVAILLLTPLGSIGEPPSPAGTDTPAPTLESPPPASPESSPSPDSSPLIADKEIKLAYDSPEGSLGSYPVELERIQAARIDKASIVVKKVIEVDQLGNYWVYVKREGDTQLYAGMPIGDSDVLGELYEIGPVGELPYLDDVQITKSNLFGEFHLRIYGACGANCVTNNWIHFEEDAPGVPISDFRLSAHAQEIDIDEDGIPEVVASESSTIGKAQVYKRFGERILFTDVNAALDAEHPNSVVYDGNRRTFTALYSDRTLEYQYKKGEDALVLSHDSSYDSSLDTDTDYLLIGGLYDGTNAIKLETADAAHDALWFKDPLQQFGFYLPERIKPIKFEDGFEYGTEDGRSLIQLRPADDSSLPYLRKEEDLSAYVDYLGSEFWGDKQTIRYDYFVYEYDAEHRTFVAIRYDVADTADIRPLLLAVAANIRYAPDVP